MQKRGWRDNFWLGCGQESKHIQNFGKKREQSHFLCDKHGILVKTLPIMALRSNRVKNAMAGTSGSNNTLTKKVLRKGKRITKQTTEPNSKKGANNAEAMLSVASSHRATRRITNKGRPSSVVNHKRGKGDRDHGGSDDDDDDSDDDDGDDEDRQTIDGRASGIEEGEEEEVVMEQEGRTFDEDDDDDANRTTDSDSEVGGPAVFHCQGEAAAGRRRSHGTPGQGRTSSASTVTPDGAVVARYNGRGQRQS